MNLIPSIPNKTITQQQKSEVRIISSISQTNTVLCIMLMTSSTVLVAVVFSCMRSMTNRQETILGNSPISKTSEAAY